MKKDRLEMFTDGVIAIVITLMVLEIQLPDLTAANFWLLARHLGIYVLSFMAVAIAWLNHHNMFVRVKQINVWVVWVNFSFLFFLSLVPLTTQPLGEHFFRKESHMFYGAVLTGLCLAGAFLQHCINRILDNGPERHKHQSNKRNWASVLLYALAIPLSCIDIYLSTAIFAMVPAIYFVSLIRSAPAA
jgi:uncharacterized membrane protein